MHKCILVGCVELHRSHLVPALACCNMAALNASSTDDDLFDLVKPGEQLACGESEFAAPSQK